MVIWTRTGETSFSVASVGKNQENHILHLYLAKSGGKDRYFATLATPATLEAHGRYGFHPPVGRYSILDL